jgi:hypothetical protein
MQYVTTLKGASCTARGTVETSNKSTVLASANFSL